MNPGPLLLGAVLVGGLGGVAAAWCYGRSLVRSLVAGSVGGALVSLLAAIGLILAFEGNIDGLLAAMRGQGLPLAGQAAALSALCGAAFGGLVFWARGRSDPGGR
jgi:hypothetical protein